MVIQHEEAHIGAVARVQVSAASGPARPLPLAVFPALRTVLASRVKPYSYPRVIMFLSKREIQSMPRTTFRTSRRMKE